MRYYKYCSPRTELCNRWGFWVVQEGGRGCHVQKHCQASPTCSRRLLWPVILHLSPHLSPTYLPLSPAPCGCSGHMIFSLVSHLSPLACGCFGRMILTLVSHCLQSSLDSKFVPCGCAGRRMISHLPPTCLALSPLPLWVLWPHDFALAFICIPLSPVRWLHTLVPHLSPTVSSLLWVLWPQPHDFTLASHCLQRFIEVFTKQSV